MEVDPEIAQHRIKNRDRKAERGDLVPLTYLQELEQGYFELLSEIESAYPAWSRGMRVIRLPFNTTKESEESIQELLRIVRSLL
jgi:thymidylate kinase